jgi:hypothetical protein
LRYVFSRGATAKLQSTSSFWEEWRMRHCMLGNRMNRERDRGLSSHRTLRGGTFGLEPVPMSAPSILSRFSWAIFEPSLRDETQSLGCRAERESQIRQQELFMRLPSRSMQSREGFEVVKFSSVQSYSVVLQSPKKCFRVKLWEVTPRHLHPAKKD